MDSCAHCKKTAAADSSPLKRCAKCKSTSYCSRSCQKSDWKVHKKTCDRGASASGSSHGFQVHSIDPSSFSAGIADDALHALPENEVYKRLIDSYRLRVEDEYVFRGNLTGVYGGQDPVAGFQEFLDLAEKRGGLLPPWWSKAKRSECVKLGSGGAEWSDLKCAVEKHDVQEHYKDSMMPLKLRVMAEKIYGTHVMG
ncbi:hypothetical protein K440DRAFT_604316 [Wilcoxina mikolae CBS 423.85]|nr:hypothetical protein K440DRAFT_604316 [Wilcoxina mikolae CBS 423.85]